MQVTALKRKFKYNGVTLPDPGPDYDAEAVKALFCGSYPELTSAVIEGPNQQGSELVYEFRKAVGTKG